MNKLKTVGISALAGTLATFSVAQAGEVSVSGAAVMSYTSLDETEVTGNPFGMHKGFSFNYSGELDNGYTWSGFVAYADGTAGMQALTSAGTTINMEGNGSLSLHQGVGSALSAIDNVVPTAWEEADDGLDTGIIDVGSVNSGTLFHYTRSIDLLEGGTFSAAYNPQVGGTYSADGATGVSTGTDGSGWDFAVSATPMDGLTVGGGYGEVEQINSEGDVDETTVYLKYAVGALTMGYQRSEEDTGNTTGTLGYNNDFVGITYQINDDLSIGFQAADNEHDKAGTDVTSEYRGYSAAYSMGALGIKFKRNDGKDINGTAGTDDTSTELSISLAF